MVNDKRLDWTFRRLQLQSQLILQRSKERGSCFVRLTATIIYTTQLSSICTKVDLEVVLTGQSCFVDDSSIQLSGEPVR